MLEVDCLVAAGGEVLVVATVVVASLTSGEPSDGLLLDVELVVVGVLLLAALFHSDKEKSVFHTNSSGFSLKSVPRK